MAVFSSLSTFFKRNRRKLLIATGLSLTAYYLVHQFVIKKFRDFQKSLKQELFVKEQIRRRFIQTQNDCYLTLLALLPVLSQPIVAHLPSETITQALKLKKAPLANAQLELVSDSLLTTDNLSLHQSANESLDLSTYVNMSKTDLWKLLKIKTIARWLTLIYSLSGLMLITRLQLNILARRSYLESAIAMAGGTVDEDMSLDYYMEQSYLSLSWWLLNKGWRTMADVLEAAVIKHFDVVNARTELTIDQFDELIALVIKDVNFNHQRLIIESIFPTSYDSLVETLINTNPDLIRELDQPESVFLKLVNETNFFVDDGMFLQIFYRMVNHSRSTLANNLWVAFDPDFLLTMEQHAKIAEIGDLPSKKFKLASFLAQVSVQSGIICDNNNLHEEYNEELSGNIYINSLNELEELDEFSAGIYSNFE